MHKPVRMRRSSPRRAAVVALVFALYTAGCGDDRPDSGPGGPIDPPDDDPVVVTYDVQFDLAATDRPLGALQFDVDYHGDTGGWLGAGAGADCRWLVPAALHACNDKRGGSLTCAIVDTNGFSGPAELMICSFKSRDSVTAADFGVRVTDASDPNLAPMEAEVVISSVALR